MHIAFCQICSEVSYKMSLRIDVSLLITKLILTYLVAVLLYSQVCLQWIVYHITFGCQEGDLALEVQLECHHLHLAMLFVGLSVFLPMYLHHFFRLVHMMFQYLWANH